MPVLSNLRDTAGIAGFAAGALRRAEAVLLAGGQQTARRNAWDAVCENRRLALDRQDPFESDAENGAGFEEPAVRWAERGPERRSPRLVVTR
jgi:hypothetical protein